MIKLSGLRGDELVKGSFILLIMIIFYNFLNYAFQISMARMLGPADYGILAVLMSIIYVIAIPGEAIQTVITRYTSKFKALNKTGKTKDLIYRSTWRGLIIALIIFILSLPVAYFLSAVLKISLSLIILTHVFIFYMVVAPIGRGFLQGNKQFSYLGWSLIIESLAKVIAAISLVYFGMNVYGAIFGVWIGAFFSLVLIIYLMKNLFKVKREHESFGNVYTKNIPVLIAITAIVLFYSIDILFARAYFSAEDAGRYAFVSLIAKVIIFISLSISKTLLPISSEEFERGKGTDRVFKKSIYLVSLVSFPILILYGLFPELIIKIVSLGSLEYIPAAPILFLLGISSTLLAFSNIIIIYSISVGKIRSSAWIVLSFVIILVALLYSFNDNIVQFSYAYLFSNLIMFLYSISFIRR
jgi:O-antigen/teichoic acid export membrane protein